MTMIELIVNMDCVGCELKIKKALQKLDGVDDVDVDMNMQKVTVMGFADQEKILKTIRKTGRKADLWPYTAQSHHNDVVQDIYYHQNYYYHSSQPHHDEHYAPNFTAYDAPISPSVMSYNYLTATHYYGGSDDDDPSYFGSYNQQYLAPYSSLVDDKASVIFSDENAHACTIM